MKFNVIAFAHASAVVTGGVYVFCALAVALLPDLSRAVTESWFHALDLGKIWTGAPRGNFVLGLASAAGGSWIVSWAFASLYNKFTK